MIYSTLGFIYTSDLQKVLLIKKNRPDWQVGKINGLGGKCEAGETSQQCVSREIREEANIHIPESSWIHLGEMLWSTWHVDVYVAIYDGDPKAIQSLTDEEVKWFSVNKLPANMLTNLPWLIPLGVDILTHPTPPKLTIEYPA